MAIKGNYQKNTLNGTALNDALYAYGDNDVLNGLAGLDTLDGGRGADTMTGGDGNDTYIVDNLNDVIIEVATANAGFDAVQSSVSWTLGANLEKLILTGTDATNGTGNAVANIIIGNIANNLLSGGDSGDILDGGLGVDSLIGGSGNDILRISDVNGDVIDGGTGIGDSLQITGMNQTLNLRFAAVHNVETIQLAEDSRSTLKVTVASVLALSSDSNTLKVDALGENTLVMDSGWKDTGLVSGYEIFTKLGATLKVNAAIGNLEVENTASIYTISDVNSAANVASVFTSNADQITIDFGGKPYSATGVTSINLLGFGLEDKLIIAQHDGLQHRGGVLFTVALIDKVTSLKAVVVSTEFLGNLTQPKPC